MEKITAVILAKNEEQTIATVLKHLSWTHEQIVVDNGSTDNTVRVARKQGAVVLSVPEKDFSRMRNEAAKKAKGDWLLYIDADEEISPELKHEILSVTHGECQAYFIKRKNYYFNTQWPHSDGMIRLIYKPALKGWQGRLHETAHINGSIGTLKNVLIHRSHNTLEDMLSKTNDWSEIEADLRFASHHPPVVSWRFFRVFMTGFCDSYFRQKGWKVGTIGLIESIYQGFSLFITYAKLWEKQRK
jgi:glycosyltransferase involved in cell wall biosynthesis